MSAPHHPRRPRPTAFPQPPTVGSPRTSGVHDVCPELPSSGATAGLSLAARLRPLRRPAAWRPATRTAVLGAATTSIAVVAVLALTTSLAGADSTPAAHRRSAQAESVPLQLVQEAAGSSSPAAPNSSAAAPKAIAAVIAPTDRAAISGLAADGIPSVALNAYRVAAARMANAEPSCGIGWSLLAGIGREESDHGQYGGAVLHADGLSTPEIIGPALNGTNGNQAIAAPADGLALDGDATYAHALGPMQFIPSTWAIYGIDADGRGSANIFDINDAALAAARYLCAAGGDLRTHAGQVRAVFSYNHTDVYVAQVLALAHAYQTGTPITGLPQGNTSGALPTLGTSGPLPPVNPGAPTANQKALAQAKQQARQKARARARQRAAAQHRHASGASTSSSRSSASSTTPHPSRSATSTSTPSSTPSPESSSPSSKPVCVVGAICLP